MRYIFFLYLSPRRFFSISKKFIPAAAMSPRREKCKPQKNEPRVRYKISLVSFLSIKPRKTKKNATYQMICANISMNYF